MISKFTLNFVCSLNSYLIENISKKLLFYPESKNISVVLNFKKSLFSKFNLISKPMSGANGVFIYTGKELPYNGISLIFEIFKGRFFLFVKKIFVLLIGE